MGSIVFPNVELRRLRGVGNLSVSSEKIGHEGAILFDYGPLS